MTTEVFICPAHERPLQRVMAGGAGWCAVCNLFVQAKGIEPPALDEHVRVKREAAAVKRAQPKQSVKLRKKERKSK